jgi:hypothetical protein
MTAVAASEKKKVMIGLPGNEFSNQFIMSWTQFLVELTKYNEFDISVCPGYSSYSPYMRMKTIGIVKQESHMKAFDGVAYDVFVTIDPTIIFTYEQFKTIVTLTEKHPVVSAHYMISEKNVCAIKKLDYEYYAKNGNFELVTKAELEEQKTNGATSITVEYTGLGFFACRRAVLQSLDYPYFWYPLIEYTSEDGMPCKDVPSDEMSFCRRLKDKGFRITLPLELRVYQEKQIIF